MYLVNIARTQLLQLIPSGGVGAKVGLKAGDFAAQMLKRANPATLHLIDPGEAEADQGDAQSRLRAAEERFAMETVDGTVQLHGAGPSELAAELPDNSLDWIYIDSAFSYEFLSRDLALAERKVKSDGLILGHGYTDTYKARKNNVQVIEAVNDFVTNGAWDLQLVTAETFATYILAQPDNPTLKEMAETMLYHRRVTAQLDGVPERIAFSTRVTMVKDQQVSLPYIQPRDGQG